MEFFGVSGAGVTKYSDIGSIISDLLLPIFSLAGMIALLFLIWGGLRYMLSRGDPKAADAARSTITSAVIGLLIVILSATIFLVFGTAFGIEIFGGGFIRTAHAQVNIGAAAGLDQFQNIGQLFTNVVRIGLAAAALVFLAMMIFGGFKYLNTGGDPKAAEGARGTLTNAVIGVLIIIVSFIIIEVISTVTGAPSIFSQVF